MSLVLTLLICLFFTAPLWAEEREQKRTELVRAAAPFEELGRVFRLGAELANESIVHISTTRLKPVHHARSTGNDVRMQVEETGTGIVVRLEDETVILTNRHVVEEVEPDQIRMETHSRNYLNVNWVRTNSDYDLAVIGFEGPAPPPMELGNSDQVRTGDLILVVGSPFGLKNSLSTGIISAVGRRKIPDANARTPICGFFQTDASVNPGSSGGPLLNLRGEAIGMITAIATQGGGHEGVAFALPIKNVVRIASQLVRNQVVQRPYVGLGLLPIDRTEPDSFTRNMGTRINRVLPNSPAAQAGLQVDDIVLFFQEIEIEDDLHLIELVSESNIGQPITWTIMRSGNIMEITITPTAQISR